MKVSTFEFNEFIFDTDYQMILGDTHENLKKFENDKFDLIITSLPYNIGKEYETKQSIKNYLDQQEEVITDRICRTMCFSLDKSK